MDIASAEHFAFKSDEVAKIALQAIQKSLAKSQYDEAKVAQWINDICEDATENLHTLKKPFKYMGMFLLSHTHTHTHSHALTHSHTLTHTHARALTHTVLCRMRGRVYCVVRFQTFIILTCCLLSALSVPTLSSLFFFQSHVALCNEQVLVFILQKHVIGIP
jgi:Tctex-1 family